VTHLQMSLSSASNNNSFRQCEANRLSCKQKDDATRSSKSLSTVSTDARSFPAPRTCALSLPTLNGSLQRTGVTSASTPPCVSEKICSDVSAKKMKVEEVDLTEDDDNEFENDLDAEMMMMMAQKTEQENSTHSSSSIVDNWRQTQASSRCNVSSTGSTMMSSSHVSQVVDRGRQHVVETSCRSTLDSGVNSSNVTRNITGSRQSANSDTRGFSNRNMMDVKDCVTDTNMKEVKHSNVASNNSVDAAAYVCSGNVAMTTSSAFSGSVETHPVITAVISYVI